MAKVCFLHFACPPVVGGVEGVLARQAELLANAGHAVSVLAGRGAAWDKRIPVHIKAELDSRHPRVLEIKQALDRGEIPPDFAALSEQLFRLLVEATAGADWIIAHNVASMHKNLALTAALRHFCDSVPKPRLILWHHDFAWNSQRYAGELHPGYPWDLLRTAWPGAVQVTISAARQEEMSRLFGLPASQIQVIPNGIDPFILQGIGPETRRLIERLGLDSASPLLLTPVRLTRRKNLELGLRILAELAHSLPGARWVITGPLGAHNPDNLIYYQQLCGLRQELGLQERVVCLAEHYPKGLSDAQVADFYRAADALLLTSQDEGFGMPIIEAGLTRLPIFTTDLAPLRALGGDWVTYFKLQDRPADIATSIARRLGEDGLYRLRDHIRANFTWKAIYTRQIAPLLEGNNSKEIP